MIVIWRLGRPAVEVCDHPIAFGDDCVVPLEIYGPHARWFDKSPISGSSRKVLDDTEGLGPVVLLNETKGQSILTLAQVFSLNTRRRDLQGY